MSGAKKDEHCLLCGTNLCGLKRRFQPREDVRKFVQAKCRPTAFVFQHLVNGGAPGRGGLCIPCVNWKRRASNGSLRRCTKPLLQLDQLILYMLDPGCVPEPDLRCMERLFCALRQAGSPLRASFPLPVQTMLGRLQGNTYLHAVAAWWEYNDRTEFFQSAGQARRVRLAFKMGVLTDSGSTGQAGAAGVHDERSLTDSGSAGQAGAAGVHDERSLTDARA